MVERREYIPNRRARREQTRETNRLNKGRKNASFNLLTWHQGIIQAARRGVNIKLYYIYDDRKIMTPHYDEDLLGPDDAMERLSTLLKRKDEYSPEEVGTYILDNVLDMDNTEPGWATKRVAVLGAVEEERDEDVETVKNFLYSALAKRKVDASKLSISDDNIPAVLREADIIIVINKAAQESVAGLLLQPNVVKPGVRIIDVPLGKIGSEQENQLPTSGVGS